MNWFFSDTVSGDISSGCDPSEPNNQTEISFHFITSFSNKNTFPLGHAEANMQTQELLIF